MSHITLENERFPFITYYTCTLIPSSPTLCRNLPSSLRHNIDDSTAVIGSSSSSGKATSKSASNISSGSPPHQPEWKDNSGQWNRKGSRYRNRTISSMPTIGEQRPAHHIRKGSARNRSCRSKRGDDRADDNNGCPADDEDQVGRLASSAPSTNGADFGGAAGGGGSSSSSSSKGTQQKERKNVAAAKATLHLLLPRLLHSHFPITRRPRRHKIVMTLTAGLSSCKLQHSLIEPRMTTSGLDELIVL